MDFIIRPYPILDEGFLETAGLRPIDLLDLWTDEGISFFQYRSKGEQKASRLDEIQRAAKRRNLRWILNDHDRLFSDGMADGLHLGWEDWKGLSEQRRQAMGHRLKQVMPLQEREGVLTGFSTHNPEQWQFAIDLHRSGKLPLSYIAFGPCFKTKSKKDGLHPIIQADALHDIEKRRDEQSKKGPLPDAVFIGGIAPDTLPELIENLQSQQVRKKGQRTIFIASIQALSDPLEIRRFRSIPNWKPA